MKRPYVKEGAIPSLFPWTEFIDKTDETNTIDNIQNTFLEKANIIEKEESSKILTFNELKCNNKLYLPIGWTRNILPSKNASVIIFNKMMYKTNKIENQLICIKEIWITEDMKMQIKALGKPINLNTFGINNEFLLSLEILEDLIKIVETFNICKAYKKSNEIECTSVALKESNNILRHKKCPIVLENLTQCNFCKSLSYILDRKRKRLNDKGNKVKRIRVDNLSPTKKNVINDIRKQKNNIMRRQNHKIHIIEKLREEIKKTQENLNTRNQQMLENAMAGKNIPIYQQEALKEILSSSLKKNAKGRRYSDKWILLCLLFHMKSPKGYDFILHNKILPLPSPSTIRRYNYFNKCTF